MRGFFSRPSIRAVLLVYNQAGPLPKVSSASRSETLSALDDLATSYVYAGVYIWIAKHVW